MRIFLDTNILIDLLDSSRKNFLQAAVIFEAAKEGYLEICISSQSFVDCAYIARKKPSRVYRDAIGRILPFVDILTITDKHLSKAVTSDCPDFEDAAQTACAEENLCEVILTSNLAHFKPFTSLTVMSPEEFVNIIKQD